jgi:hypothetical protein
MHMSGESLLVILLAGSRASARTNAFWVRARGKRSAEVALRRRRAYAGDPDQENSVLGKPFTKH